MQNLNWYAVFIPLKQILYWVLCGSLASSFYCTQKETLLKNWEEIQTNFFFSWTFSAISTLWIVLWWKEDKAWKCMCECVNGYFANSCMAITYSTTGTQMHLCRGEKIKMFNVSGHFNCNSLLRIGLNLMCKWQYKYCLICCKLEDRYKGSYYF